MQKSFILLDFYFVILHITVFGLLMVEKGIRNTVRNVRAHEEI